jgi:Flp pilus assembly pilin Flp
VKCVAVALPNWTDINRDALMGEYECVEGSRLGGQMKALLKRFAREDAGQDLVEYGLLLGLISAATVAIISELGTAVVGQFSKMEDLID